MTVPALETFRHRATYDGEAGCDRFEVRIVNAWVRSIVPPLLAGVPPGPVVDAGCGEQPFRALIEANARAYIGMDVVQNSSNSVAVLSDLESVPLTTARYPFVLCTEVLEHVADIDRSFAGLRRLTAPGGCVVLTVPFLYPVHMEPYDFRRMTEYGIAGLADAHGFDMISFERLGGATDALALLLDDVSVLPETRSPYDRLKARVLRAARTGLVALLASPLLASHVAINAHYYLSNGVVLKAR